mmetsp:Transcript_293/g.513  ORF Transcript_293/g.513 Transcript_293/m.513 type:complete len:235 (-) Transcript_293:2184-2888(-)
MSAEGPEDAVEARQVERSRVVAPPEVPEPPRVAGAAGAGLAHAQQVGRERNADRDEQPVRRRGCFADGEREERSGGVKEGVPCGEAYPEENGGHGGVQARAVAGGPLSEGTREGGQQHCPEHDAQHEGEVAGIGGWGGRWGGKRVGDHRHRRHDLVGVQVPPLLSRLELGEVIIWGPRRLRRDTEDDAERPGLYRDDVTRGLAEALEDGSDTDGEIRGIELVAGQRGDEFKVGL